MHSSRKLAIIFGDQLSQQHPALAMIDHAHDHVLMMEVHDELIYTRHHIQKIVLILSAMRHFAHSLNHSVKHLFYSTMDQVPLENIPCPDNAGNFVAQIKQHILTHSIKEVLIMHPGEYRVLEMIHALSDWTQQQQCQVNILPDCKFIVAPSVFSAWANGKKQWTMEYFYRLIRKKTGYLMEGNNPEGGAWNFDKDNRKTLKDSSLIKARPKQPKDHITQQVQNIVASLDIPTLGTMEHFYWAVTREDALSRLDDFITHHLPHFGDYQDALTKDQPFMFHSLLSPYINIGLLSPQEVCEAALEAYKSRLDIPINAIEGFIRQIIGWREFVNGLYWHTMPEYKTYNALQAHQDLPSMFWDGKTNMTCMQQAIQASLDYSYAHHIQRLMITGNFALLAGLSVEQVTDWYLGIYIDAFEWVELPNTLGMALFADGALVGTKPYCASGAYVNKMSNYCKTCVYNVKERVGAKSCPVNSLYWSFLIKHEDTLGKNHRMALTYKHVNKLSDEDRTAITATAAHHAKHNYFFKAQDTTLSQGSLL